MRVGLIAHLAKVGLVARVDVHVFLAVAAVGEAPVAAFELALEGLLSWCEGEKFKINLWLLSNFNKYNVINETKTQPSGNSILRAQNPGL